MIETAMQGFLLGLATGHICLATCGPIYLPMILMRTGSVKEGLSLLMKITGGRFITYALFGIVAGWTGSMLSETARSFLTGGSYILVTVFLLFTVFQKKKNCSSGCGAGQQNKHHPFVLGMIMGLSLCPSFLLAIIRAVDLSGPVAGLVLFSAFFVATTLYILPLSFIGKLGRSLWFQKAAKFAAAGVAVWCLVQAWEPMKDGYTRVTIKNKTMTFMDSTTLVVAGFSGGEPRIVSSHFAPLRDGSVRVEELSDDLSDVHVICDDQTAASHVELLKTLKAQGCCILVLNRQDQPLTGESLASVSDFLTKIRFVKQSGKGFIYHLPVNQKKTT